MTNAETVNEQLERALEFFKTQCILRENARKKVEAIENISYCGMDHDLKQAKDALKRRTYRRNCAGDMLLAIWPNLTVEQLKEIELEAKSTVE